MRWPPASRAKLAKPLAKSSVQGAHVSAQQFHLYSSLQEAWESGALSFRELWEMQDQLLLSQERWLEVPQQLELHFNKLAFFQAPPANRLPL
jgi:hypothetical protein